MQQKQYKHNNHRETQILFLHGLKAEHKSVCG